MLICNRKTYEKKFTVKGEYAYSEKSNVKVLISTYKANILKISKKLIFPVSQPNGTLKVGNLIVCTF